MRTILGNPSENIVAIITTIMIATILLTAPFGIAGAVAATDKRVEKFESWEVRCFNDQRGCAAILDNQSAQIVVVQTRKEKTPQMMIHIPPQAKKGEPVAMHLNSGVTFHARVWKCTKKFCMAPINPDALATILPRLIADTDGVIAYSVNDTMSIVPFSLMGFSKALKAVRR